MTLNNNEIMMPRHSTVRIPVEVLRYVNEKRMIRPFAAFLYLKMYSDGKVLFNSPLIKQLRKDLRIRLNETFDRYIQTLLELNWIGLSRKSGYLFIRSFDYLRFKHQIKSRQYVIAQTEDLHRMRYFVPNALIGAKVESQRFSTESLSKAVKETVAEQRAAANQSSEAPLDESEELYYGLSKQGIANLLNCSLSRATQHKNNGRLYGYLRYFHKFRVLTTTAYKDYNIRNILVDLCDTDAHKLRVNTIIKDGEIAYEWRIQLYDEIVPCIKFYRGRKYKHLRLSEPLKRLHLSVIHKERRAEALAKKTQRKLNRATWDAETAAACQKSALYMGIHAYTMGSQCVQA